MIDRESVRRFLVSIGYAVDGASRFDPSRDNRPPENFYASAEANDALVWRICEYRHEDCRKCPALQDEPGHGKCKMGCRAIAEEMVAIVLASTAHDDRQTWQNEPPRGKEVW